MNEKLLVWVPEWFVSSLAMPSLTISLFPRKAARDQYCPFGHEQSCTGFLQQSTFKMIKMTSLACFCLSFCIHQLNKYHISTLLSTTIMSTQQQDRITSSSAPNEPQAEGIHWDALTNKQKKARKALLKEIDAQIERCEYVHSHGLSD
jgi:hypothetical protein